MSDSAQQPMAFEPLTPTAFLRRSDVVFGDRIAVIDGEVRYTYAEFLDRTERLAGALRALGVTDGARVAVLAPNTHVLLEAHYGVPLAGNDCGSSSSSACSLPSSVSASAPAACSRPAIAIALAIISAL